MNNQSADDEPSSRLERRELLRQDDVLARVVGDVRVPLGAREARLFGDVAARVILVGNSAHRRPKRSAASASSPSLSSGDAAINIVVRALPPAQINQ